MAEYIEREAVLDALQAPEICNITSRHIELIKQIPSAKVAPVSWISVKDRLPDVNRTKSGYESVYVIATDGKRVLPMIFERACVKTKMKFRWKYVWDRIYDRNDIIAWMPLPEPPRMDGAGRWR